LTSPSDIDRFLSLRSFAVVGASRDRSKYGNIVYRELRSRGFRVFAVNPRAAEIEGEPSYPALDALPEPVDGAVIVVPPAETERAVRAAVAGGIRAIWMQPGAESEAAIRTCEENGLCTIHSACVLLALRRAFSSGGLQG
jgi:predicted CoA-binding protein